MIVSQMLLTRPTRDGHTHPLHKELGPNAAADAALYVLVQIQHRPTCSSKNDGVDLQLKCSHLAESQIYVSMGG